MWWWTPSPKIPTLFIFLRSTEIPAALGSGVSGLRNKETIRITCGAPEATQTTPKPPKTQNHN
jgi:hypothetical protein